MAVDFVSSTLVIFEASLLISAHMVKPENGVGPCPLSTPCRDTENPQYFNQRLNSVSYLLLLLLLSS